MSGSTTSFDEWLDQVNLNYYADVYALHQAIEGETSFASYTAVRAPNGWLVVTAPSVATKLVLNSEKAKKALLDLICARHVEPGMQIDAWYGMEHQNESD